MSAYRSRGCVPAPDLTTAAQAADVDPVAAMKISICIPTYRRPDRLRALLDDLSKQTLLPREVVVVDNDAAGSARAVVDAARSAGMPFPIHYDVQPEKNIALTRNRTVELAQSDWLAFIDDDERAPPRWLGSLSEAAGRHAADGVLGPVVAILPATAPAWLHRGHFYDWARMRTGTVVPVRLLRFGNVLLSARILRTGNPVFDPAYGLTGGEDGDLLARLVLAGARICWCDEAIVTEPVEPARQSLHWLLLRALRGGQDFARHVQAGRHGAPTAGRRALLMGRALLQMIVAAILVPLCLTLGRHRAAYWLTKAAANLGKLSTFAGLHYREYA